MRRHPRQPPRLPHHRSGWRRVVSILCPLNPSIIVSVNLDILSVCIRVHPWPKTKLRKADRTPKKTSDLATDGHGFTRMRIAGFLGTKLYGYVLAKKLYWNTNHDEKNATIRTNRPDCPSTAPATLRPPLTR